MQKSTHTQTNRLHSEFLLKCLIYYMVHVRFMFIHWFDKLRYIFENLYLLLGCWLFYAGSADAFFSSLSFSIFYVNRMWPIIVLLLCIKSVARSAEVTNRLIKLLSFFFHSIIRALWMSEWMNEWTLFSIYASLCHTCFFSLARLSKQQATPHSTTAHHITHRHSPLYLVFVSISLDFNSLAINARCWANEQIVTVRIAKH